MSGSPHIRTPLARVRGFGTAKSGTAHFWHQRVTAIANVPLTIAAVIIEDYVHDESAKLALLMANTFFTIVVGLAAAYGILKLSFGL